MGNRVHLNTIIDSELHLWSDQSENMPQLTKEDVQALIRHVGEVNGGALVVVGPKESLKKLHFATTDKNYMSNKLKNVEVSDASFGKIFAEFTEHDRGDRWPLTHEDEEARGMPKDGAILVHASAKGTKTKAAVKILGCEAPCNWPSSGNRHETAGAVAGKLDRGIVFVRSSGSEGSPGDGQIHILLAQDEGRKAFALKPFDKYAET